MNAPFCPVPALSPVRHVAGKPARRRSNPLVEFIIQPISLSRESACRTFPEQDSLHGLRHRDGRGRVAKIMVAVLIEHRLNAVEPGYSIAMRANKTRHGPWPAYLCEQQVCSRGYPKPPGPTLSPTPEVLRSHSRRRSPVSPSGTPREQAPEVLPGYPTGMYASCPLVRRRTGRSTWQASPPQCLHFLPTTGGMKCVTYSPCATNSPPSEQLPPRTPSSRRASVRCSSVCLPALNIGLRTPFERQQQACGWESPLHSIDQGFRVLGCTEFFIEGE